MERKSNKKVWKEISALYKIYEFLNIIIETLKDLAAPNDVTIVLEKLFNELSLGNFNICGS